MDDSQIPMLVLTDALRSPQVRIGRIGGNFTLPRTVKLVSLLAGGAGAAIGLMLALIFFGGSLKPSLYFSILLGAGGVFVTSWSPIKGESLSKWLGLSVQNRRKKIKVEGQEVTLAVGIAVLSEVRTGDVHLIPGAVNIPVTQYDERGVRLSREALFDRLLDEQGDSESPWLGTHSGAGVEMDDGEGGDAWRSRGALSTHRQLMRRASDVVAGIDDHVPPVSPAPPSPAPTSAAPSPSAPASANAVFGRPSSAGAFGPRPLAGSQQGPVVPPMTPPAPPMPVPPIAHSEPAVHTEDSSALPMFERAMRERPHFKAPSTDSLDEDEILPAHAFGAPVLGDGAVEAGPERSDDDSGSGWVRVAP